jgi:hypothetical protein
VTLLCWKRGRASPRPTLLGRVPVGAVPCPALASAALGSVSSSAGEVKVIRVEICELLQAVYIHDGQAIALEGEQIILAQLLDHPINMDSCDLKRVRKFGLRDRKLIAVLACETHGLEAQQ